MKNYKSVIVKKYGTPVEVHRYLGDLPIRILETKAVLGRATRSNTNLKTSENQKEGIFLPRFEIDGGDFVINKVHGEDYVVVTTHQEYDGKDTLSIVANMMKCSYRMTLKGNTRVTDARGNLKSAFGEKYKDVPCYLEQISNELRQFEPGLNPDTEHRIYTTDLDIELTDQVVITEGRRELVLRVVALDYFSFPGLVVIEVAKDIRK